jgi:hypothetical protein
VIKKSLELGGNASVRLETLNCMYVTHLLKNPALGMNSPISISRPQYVTLSGDHAFHWILATSVEV